MVIRTWLSGMKVREQSSGHILQFETTRNRFLAAGDEFQIKLWDMDNTNILTKKINVDDSSVRIYFWK